jgi:hypothetical protein
MARRCLVCLLGAVLSGSVLLGETPERLVDRRVRGESQSARRLLQDGLRLSPTFARLVDRIEHSDLIVYVRLQSVAPGTVGATQLVASSHGTRYVLVTIGPQALELDLLARLAHELQHVTEIADAVDVRDDAGLRRLFRQIGWASGSDRWETQAAVDLGRRVLGEVWVEPRDVTQLARAR